MDVGLQMAGLVPAPLFDLFGRVRQLFAGLLVETRVDLREALWKIPPSVDEAQPLGDLAVAAADQLGQLVEDAIVVEERHREGEATAIDVVLEAERVVLDADLLHLDAAQILVPIPVDAEGARNHPVAAT